MHYTIRPIEPSEVKLLDIFLYEAIYIPEGVEAPSLDIIQKPELQVYVKDFGRSKGDNALVAIVDGQLIGAVWTRIMDDYGHVDNATPSFAISLFKEFRHFGIGTAMMKQMLSELKKQGYKQASLAVQKDNYATRMYRNVGFCTIAETTEEYIMTCKL